MISNVNEVWAAEEDFDDDQERSTTELDSHANMCVVGQQATIINKTGKHAEVRAFSKECQTIKRVPIVDAAFAYDCPTTMKTYLLIVRNALHVPSMEHNLIPPFIMREGGLVVNDIPRIHSGEEVGHNTHCILAHDGSLRIPLQLKGIFSYFPTRTLTPEENEDPEALEAVLLTPDAATWSPNDSSYREHEESFLNEYGEPVDRPSKRRRLLEEVDVEGEVAAYKTINVTGEEWEAAIDSVVSQNGVEMIPKTCHEV